MTATRTATQVLTVSDVSVRLGGRTVLDHVGFSLGAGEVTGLIGSNGAGKTTLLKVLLGQLRPSSGTVSAASAPASGAASPEAGRIGYVPQKFMLDPDLPLRGRDLVGLGLDGNRPGFPLRSRSRAARVQEMLEAVGAADIADARVGQLSGGEQQRILIAHALISGPQLLLLDEPLANLDLASAKGVVALLSRLAGEQDLAVLISAHEMNTLLPAMDRVVYLADGRAAEGTTDEVIRSDVLSELYGHHVDVVRVHDRVVVIAGDAVEKC